MCTSERDILLRGRLGKVDREMRFMLLLIKEAETRWRGGYGLEGIMTAECEARDEDRI